MIGLLLVKNANSYNLDGLKLKPVPLEKVCNVLTGHGFSGIHGKWTCSGEPKALETSEYIALLQTSAFGWTSPEDDDTYPTAVTVSLKIYHKLSKTESVMVTDKHFKELLTRAKVISNLVIGEKLPSHVTNLIQRDPNTNYTHQSIESNGVNIDVDIFVWSTGRGSEIRITFN
jgi:hypothetical protein